MPPPSSCAQGSETIYQTTIPRALHRQQSETLSSLPVKKTYLLVLELQRQGLQDYHTWRGYEIVLRAHGPGDAIFVLYWPC